MGWLIGFFGGFLGMLFRGLGKFLFRFLAPIFPASIRGFLKLINRYGKVFLLITYLGLVVVAFTVAVSAAGAVISFTAPADFVAIGRMFLPGNTSVCIAVLITAKMLQVVMIWKVRIAELFASA